MFFDSLKARWRLGTKWRKTLRKSEEGGVCLPLFILVSLSIFFSNWVQIGLWGFVRFFSGSVPSGLVCFIYSRSELRNLLRKSGVSKVEFVWATFLWYIFCSFFFSFCKSKKAALRKGTAALSNADESSLSEHLRASFWRLTNTRTHARHATHTHIRTHTPSYTLEG